MLRKTRKGTPETNSPGISYLEPVTVRSGEEIWAARNKFAWSTLLSWASIPDTIS